MKVLVATVGGTEEPVIVAARKLGLDKAVLIAGKPASEVFDNPVKNDVNPLAVSDSIRKKLESVGVKVDVVTVNPFNFEECCVRAIEVIEREMPEEVNVIVTGGTKIQAIATSYAAFVCGCRMFYVQETKNGSEILEIPLRFSDFDELSRSRKLVLKVLEDGDDAGSVARKLGINRKTASQYLKELREYGLVESTGGRVRKYRLTFAGKICRARWG